MHNHVCVHLMYTYICVNACICHLWCVLMCICLCIYVNVCIYVWYMCVYMYVYAYMYMYICVCMYVSIYIHTQNFLLDLLYSISWLFHSSLSNYNSICWCWTARRYVYFELTQEEFLSFSQNTFVYLFVYFIRIRPACYPATIMTFSITQIDFLSASSNSKYNYNQNVMLANQSITYTVEFTVVVMK